MLVVVRAVLSSLSEVCSHLRDLRVQGRLGVQVLTRRHDVSPRAVGDQLDECCFDGCEAPGPSHEPQQVQACGEVPLQPTSRDCGQAGEVVDEREDQADVVEEEAPEG